MPSRIFEAETYRVQVLRGGTTITRTIRIGGVDPADDDNATADHATFSFIPASKLGTNAGTIRVPRLFGNYSASAFLPESDFDSVYRMVQTEKPLFVRVHYESKPKFPGSTTHNITQIAIGSEDVYEPLGEGETDADAIVVEEPEGARV